MSGRKNRPKTDWKPSVPQDLNGCVMTIGKDPVWKTLRMTDDEMWRLRQKVHIMLQKRRDRGVGLKINTKKQNIRKGMRKALKEYTK